MNSPNHEMHKISLDHVMGRVGNKLPKYLKCGVLGLYTVLDFGMEVEDITPVQPVKFVNCNTVILNRTILYCFI